MASRTNETVGILHPGLMGASVAAAARAGGSRVVWASQGRSSATAGRAQIAGLEDVGTVENLAGTSSIILSVCPPAFATDVAGAVAPSGFTGLFVDANAISPNRTRSVAKVVTAGGAQYVDGGIVGGPDFSRGRTYLYLSGTMAEKAAEVFAQSDLKTEVLGAVVGAASALKMTYAAYTKGTTALIGGILAVAEKEGVRQELLDQWKRSIPDLAAGAEDRIRSGTAKAWRFAGEMEEIADTFVTAGIPDGFHRAAAELFRRQAGFKDAGNRPDLEEVLAALLGS